MRRGKERRRRRWRRGTRGCLDDEGVADLLLGAEEVADGAEEHAGPLEATPVLGELGGSLERGRKRRTGGRKKKEGRERRETCLATSRPSSSHFFFSSLLAPWTSVAMW